MPIRIVIFGKSGDGAAYSAMAQLRSLVMEMRLDASVQIITDATQLKMNGIDSPPAVSIDGAMVSHGWVPARMEMQRALQQRMAQLSAHKGGPGSSL